MSFARVNPSGWGSGSKLTSAQQNQLDINVSKAVDKSIAGDSISGAITFLTGSGLTINAGSSLSVAGPTSLSGTVSLGAAFDMAAGAIINVETGAEVNFETGSTCNFGASASITGTCTVASGASLTCAVGATIAIAGLMTVPTGGIVDCQSGGTINCDSGGGITCQTGSIVVLAGIVEIPNTATLTVNAPLGASSGSAFNFAQVTAPLTTLSGTTVLSSTQYNSPCITVTLSGPLSGDCVLQFPPANAIYFLDIYAVQDSAAGHSFNVTQGGVVSRPLINSGTPLKTGMGLYVIRTRTDGSVSIG